MKLLKYIYLPVGLALFVLQTKAQDIQHDSIQWNAGRFTDVISNVVVEIPCKFITSEKSIVWIQAEGEVVDSISIDSIEGTWPDLNQDGGITYHVNLLNKLTGNIKISRNGQTLKLLIDLSGTYSIKNEYSITDFESL